MEWDREKGEVLYRTGRGHAEERGSEDDRRDDLERIDELEFLARVVTQLPEPRKHSIRYYGYYAAVVRGKRRRATAGAEASMPATGNDAVGNDATEAEGKVGGVRLAVAVHSAVASEPDTTERKLLRKRWAQLIRRVYEVDPLLSRVRRDHADRRDHHREERHHKDPRAHEESGRNNHNGRTHAPALPGAYRWNGWDRQLEGSGGIPRRYDGRGKSTDASPSQWPDGKAPGQEGDPRSYNLISGQYLSDLLANLISVTSLTYPEGAKLGGEGG